MRSSAQQPEAELRLPLTEQLEIEVPDLLDALDPVVRMVLVRHQRAKTCAAGLPERRCCQVGHATRPLGQPRAKLRE